MVCEPIAKWVSCMFIMMCHSHHNPAQGWKWGFGAYINNILCGVITIGRPVSFRFNGTNTLEVTRCCTDGEKHVCSMLYGMAFRAAVAMHYDTIITYTLESEACTSLIAAGWKFARYAGGGDWDSDARPRGESWYPTCRKKLWYKSVLPDDQLPTSIFGSVIKKAPAKETSAKSRAKKNKPALRKNSRVKKSPHS